MDPAEVPRHRHVWVDRAGGIPRCPGLVLAWRAAGSGAWEANVAVVGDSSVLVTWVPAADLHPVADDRWRDPDCGRLR